VARKRPIRTTISRPANSPIQAKQESLAVQDRRRVIILIVLTVIVCFTIFANLRQPWAPLPWLFGIIIWAFYIRPERVEMLPMGANSISFPTIEFLGVLVVASAVRLFKITEFPLGPYADEIFTLNDSLNLLEQSFDFFGHTPLIMVGWVETSNLYLYFNLLILQLFGVSYWSMKLFSIIPGIVACGAFFLIARLLFSPRVAFLTALLFTFAHWPVRLSRYGWDVSFMIMTFSLAVWLLVLAMQRGRPLYSYLAGLIAGLSLYSYLGARICLISLLLFLTFEFAMTRGRSIFRHLTAFAIGAAMAAYPLLCYHLSNPSSFWVRTTELSVFNSGNPLAEIINNIWRHALMFFTLGGRYARDNFPGLPMMDPLTGLLFIAGLVILIRNIKSSSMRLVAWIFLVNFAAGIFSISQEGAPYVYRTAAVMIPAFLIVGLGLQWLTRMAESKFGNYPSSKKIVALAWSVALLIIGLNLYFYFGLEAKNAGATRVMAYELRLIGLEISQDDLPVVLIGRDILDPFQVDASPEEKYAYANPPLPLPPAARKLAVVNFSGRYDPRQTVAKNFAQPKNIFFVEPAFLETNNLKSHGPTKIIFKSRNRQISALVRQNYPDAPIKNIPDIYGEPLFAVATLSRPSAAAPEASAVK